MPATEPLACNPSTRGNQSQGDSESEDSPGFTKRPCLRRNKPKMVEKKNDRRVQRSKYHCGLCVVRLSWPYVSENRFTEHRHLWAAVKTFWKHTAFKPHLPTPSGHYPKSTWSSRLRPPSWSPPGSSYAVPAQSHLPHSPHVDRPKCPASLPTSGQAKVPRGSTSFPEWLISISHVSVSGMWFFFS